MVGRAGGVIEFIFVAHKIFPQFVCQVHYHGNSVTFLFKLYLRAYNNCLRDSKA